MYLNHILIYLKTSLEYKDQVCKVLAKLSNTGLLIKFKKYKFLVTKTPFLDFVISTNSIKMELAKVKAVLNWKTSKLVKDI